MDHETHSGYSPPVDAYIDDVEKIFNRFWPRINVRCVSFTSQISASNEEPSSFVVVNTLDWDK